MAKRTDLYPNRAIQAVTLSAANTLTFAQMRFGFGVFGGTAIVLHRMEFHLPVAAMNGLVANTDAIRLAITNRDDLTALSPTNMNVLIFKELTTTMVGAVVGIQVNEGPILVDLARLPGGGMIIPPNPLFFAMVSEGLAAAISATLVMYYTTLTLTDADYVELVQSLIPVNI